MKKVLWLLPALCACHLLIAQVKPKKAAPAKPKTVVKKAVTKPVNKTPSNSKMNIFSPAPWISNTDVYEVNVRQYTKDGNFFAFRKEMPRLRAMGVSTLWFMPITPIAQKNKKGSLGSPYACSDYTSINPEFGTLEDFKMLVKDAHEQGFKVIIDWVANHTGWDHVWTVSHPEYYEKEPATGEFKIASGMDDIIELDFRNKEMRRAMIDAMKYWVQECDIDGFRCDLAFWVELDFWMEARKELETVKKLFWLAECDGIDHHEYLKVFDAAYSWTWMHKTTAFYKEGGSVQELRDLLTRYDTIAGNTSARLWFTTNHDENSWNGTEYEKYGEAAAALAVLSFTWNGIPLIYSGQELPNHKRLEFFEKDEIKWDGEYRVAGFYSTLLSLRKNNPALRAGDPQTQTKWIPTTEAPNLLAYRRKYQDREVLVFLNLGKEAVQFNIQPGEVDGSYLNVFTGESANLHEKTELQIPAWGYLVFEK